MKIKLLILILLYIYANCETKEQIFLDVPFETGFIKLKETSDIFYWLFHSEKDPSSDPLIFWLTGGKYFFVLCSPPEKNYY
jgi:carboxypeptidase C (cathepsin A)